MTRNLFNPLPGTTPIAIEVHCAGTRTADGRLEGAQCRWPIGYPARYCGIGTDGHRDYCPAHQRMAYRPAPGNDEKDPA